MRALVTALALVAVLAPVASAGWGRPTRLAGPADLDLITPQVALSQAALAVGYAVQDVDAPASSMTLLLRRGAGAFAPRQVPEVQQPLALAFRGRDLELLAGASESGRSCCSIVQAIGPIGGGSNGRQTTLFTGLAGATTARLVALPARLLAAVATERGVWTAQTGPRSNDFGAVHRVSGPRQLPQAMDAVASPGGRNFIAWSARTDSPTSAGPRTVFLAQGTARRSPGAGHAVLVVPLGHAVDELALAPGDAGASMAWIESWFDRRGGFHSVAREAMLGRGRLSAVTLSAPRERAAGLAYAGSGTGAQVLSWKGCDAGGVCGVRAVLFSTAGRKPTRGPVWRVGGIDPAQDPAVVVARDGRSLIGWIQNGHVLSALARLGRLGRVYVVSRTDYASGLSLTGAPGGGTEAVWTQGTLAQSLVGARFGPL